GPGEAAAAADPDPSQARLRGAGPRPARGWSGRVTKTVIKLAAFVAVCTVFMLYLAFTIGNIHLFEHTYKVSATFDDVTGLLPNDNVKVAGVPVGKVTGIKIVDGRAKVTFTVRRDVKLPSDSQAAVRWRNLLGQRYVYVYPGAASTMLQKGDGIGRTKSVVELGALFNVLDQAVTQLGDFSNNLGKLLADNRVHIDGTINSLTTLTDLVRTKLPTLDSAVANLDNASRAIFNASRYGQWLNQTIPCGAVTT